MIQRLWKLDQVQAAYERRNKFQLVECAKYFLSRVDEVLLPDYIPNNQDIVQTRVKTSGIIEHDFEITTQGSARKKLILVSEGTYFQRTHTLPIDVFVWRSTPPFKSATDGTYKPMHSHIQKQSGAALMVALVLIFMIYRMW